MAEYFDISSSGFPTKFTADTTQGSAERFELNFAGWIQDDPITTVTWSVVGGRAGISEETVTDNVVSALINFNYDVGNVLLKVVVETGEESFIGYIDVTVRNADYGQFNDYSFYHSTPPPPNASYPVPYVTFEGIETLTNKTINALDNDLTLNGLIVAGANVNIAGIGSLLNPYIINVNSINANIIGTGVVSNTEFQYLDGLTSPIQTQIDSKLSNITGLIDDGTNIAITGTGAAGDPYIISSSAAGVTDGDKGDITVSSTGSVWTIDNLAVTDAKINSVAASKVTGTKTSTFISDFSAAADARITAQKAMANGLATLDGGSKIPTSQLPAIAIVDVNTVSSQAAQLALTAEEGDVAVRTDLNKSYIHNGGTSGTMADWQELLTPTDAVLSVNGQTGAVNLTTSNITEGSNLYFTNARAIAATLTGYTSGAGTVSSSDSVLSAIQKLNGNIAAVSAADDWTVTGSDIYNNNAGNVGVGTAGTATGKLEVRSTTEQLRLSYDASNRATITVASNGTITLASTAAVGVTGLITPNRTITGNGLALALHTVNGASGANYNGTRVTTAGTEIIYLGRDGAGAGSDDFILRLTGSVNPIKVVSSGAVTDSLVINAGNTGFGTGTTISAKTHVIGTTEQQRLGYDVSNYLSTTVASTGSVTFALTGTSPVFNFSQQVLLNAGFATSSAGSNSNLYVPNARQPFNTTNANLLFAGAASVGARVVVMGDLTATLTANSVYANFLVGSSPIAVAATGTHSWLANVEINPIGTVTGAAAKTNSANLLINAASTAATNNYSLAVIGKSRFDAVFNAAGTDLTANQVWAANTAGTAMEGKTITPGTGITVTPGTGTITIAATGGGSAYYTWSEVTGTTQALAASNAYIANNVALGTYTLPATAALGDRFIVSGKGAGGWKITQNASQTIRFGNVTTTSGTGGSLQSTDAGDHVEIVCITANTAFKVINVLGNVTYV